MLERAAEAEADSSDGDRGSLLGAAQKLSTFLILGPTVERCVSDATIAMMAQGEDEWGQRIGQRDALSLSLEFLCRKKTKRT